MALMCLYPSAPKPLPTLGSEACGIVESIGKNVIRFKPVDKVMEYTKDRGVDLIIDPVCGRGGGIGQ